MKTRRTVLVRVLNTRRYPAAVPTNIFFPVGSKRAVVIGELDAIKMGELNAVSF